jgi:hypothetical protein
LQWQRQSVEKKHQHPESLWYYFVGSFGLTMIAELCRYGISPLHYERFARIVSDPLNGYMTTVFHNKITAFYQESTSLHVVTVLFLVTLVWSFFALRQGDQAS